MAIKVSQAFERTSANPIDATLALTKAQMKTVNDNLMPSKYFTSCQEDGYIYLYDKSNEVDETTGRFRKFEGGLTEIDYADALNKPQINGVTLSGNKTASELGIDVPTKVSDLTNDSEFIDKTVNNLTNYYLSTNTYTKTEVDSLINAAKSGRFVLVNALPTEDIQTNVIYLVPKSTGITTSNIKDEYINIDGTSLGWELIGDTTIDLSGYVTDSDLQTALADYTTTANLATVATSGAYSDLSGKPTIPAKISDLTNDSDFVESTDLATVATSGAYSDLTGTPTIPADIDDLSDVVLTTPTDGQVLTYDETTQKFVNADPTGGGGDASLESAVTSNLAVGAIASGTTLAQGTTFTQFVQKLLITEIAPTISFSISKSGNVVYGGSYTETLTVSCSAMGTAKKIKSIAWYEGSTLKQTDAVDSATTGSWTYTMSTATTDTTTFKAIITYTKSNDADESTTKTASINFYYNKFYGSVSDLNPSEATVEALTTALGTGRGGTYSFTTSASRICYAYPKSLGALTSIKDGNGFSLFDSFTRTEQTYTQNGTSVAYYRYVLTDPTTVSGYSVIFA